MNVIREIIRKIADYEGVDPLDLDPPLGAVVNTRLIEAVADDSRHGEPMLSSPLAFEYHGYSVTINPGGDVDISDVERPQTEHPRAESSRSPKSHIDEITREQAMMNASDIIAARDRPFAKRLDGLLQVIRNTLGLDAAILSYVDDGSYVFEAVDGPETADIQAGEVVPLAETVCERVVETEQTLVLRDAEAEAPDLEDSALGVAAYLGVPVFVDGEVYGTFCFFDGERRAEAFSEWELAFVELLGNWVSTELELRRREWTVQRLGTERQYSTS